MDTPPSDVPEGAVPPAPPDTTGGFPDGVKVIDGHITMPELPGIGFEGKSDLIKVMRELAE